MGVQEIFNEFPGHICSVISKYVIIVLEKSDRSPGDTSLVSSKYLICVLEIFDRCLGNI